MSLFNQLKIRIDNSHGIQYWDVVVRYQPDTLQEMLALAERLTDMQKRYKGIELICSACETYQIRQPHTIESFLFIADIVHGRLSETYIGLDGIPLTKEEVKTALADDIAWFKERGYEPQYNHTYEDGPWIN